MKNILSKLSKFFVTVFGILLVLIIGVFYVILLPYDYIRYKCSLFYKRERKKYKLFSGFSVYFDLYNEICKNNLPIKYIFNPNNNAIECGWFVYNKTLLLPDVAVEYYPDVENWFCCEYDGGHDVANVPLSQYLEQEINTINEAFESEICDNAIVLLDEIQVENFDKAKCDKRFLFYNDNRKEVLQNFCKFV